MKNIQISRKIILGLFIAINFGIIIPQTVFCQTEKLGIVQYTPPQGMTKTPKPNIIGFSEFNQTAGTYCIITLYGATNSSGNPTADFSREWNKLVVKNMQAEANPKTDSQTSEGWTIISGGAEVESEAGKAVGFLTVISGFGKTVSILAVFNDPASVKKIDAFIGSLEMDKVTAPANIPATSSQPPTLDSNGKLVIPLPARQLTINDLIGEWGESSQRISTTYVNRSDGSYAGTDSLAFTSKNTFDSNGNYTNDFFAIRNGSKIIDKTIGTIAVVGRIIYLKRPKSTTKYVIRGWLELPDMTILKIVGPWFDDQEIPEDIFTNPEKGANLNKEWVRKK